MNAISRLWIGPTRIGLFGSLVLGLLLPLALVAQIPQGVEGSFAPHPEAEEAISQLYSPYCPGFMLAVCTAQQSAVLRDSIQAFAYQGWSSEELVEWMLGNHGEAYRAVPRTRGWAAFAWILPPLALALGAVMVVMALLRFRSREPTTESVRPDPGVEKIITAEEQARLRSAIREIELSEDPSF